WRSANPPPVGAGRLISRTPRRATSAVLSPRLGANHTTCTPAHQEGAPIEVSQGRPGKLLAFLLVTSRHHQGHTWRPCDVLTAPSCRVPGECLVTWIDGVQARRRANSDAPRRLASAYVMHGTPSHAVWGPDDWGWGGPMVWRSDGLAATGTMLYTLT